jgi:site-specific recombinase XerD
MPAPAARLLRAPKYRHYQPKNLGVVRINGRDHYLGPYGTPESWERYHRLVAEYLASGGVSLPAADAGPPSVSVNAVILAFMKAHVRHYCRSDGSQTGELRNFADSLRPLKKLYGTTPATDFGPKRLNLVRDDMIESGLARNTINQRIGRIRHVFKWATEQELVPASVFHGLQAVAGLKRGRSAARETDPVCTVPDADVDAVQSCVPRQVWAMIEIQRLTGMRPGEVCQLRTRDLDMAREPWVFTPAHHKTECHGKVRAIQIGPKGREVLKPWLKADREAWLFSPSEARDERYAAMRARRKSRLQPSQKNRRKAKPKRQPAERYTVRTYHAAVRRGCARAFPHSVISKIPPRERTPEQLAELRAWQRGHSWHPNQLRHNMATRLRRDSEGGLETAGAVLGHSDLATTLIYAERNERLAADAIERVG